MTALPDEFEPQVIDGADADTVISLLVKLCEGPREAMALIAVVVKKLNAAPFRDGDLPSNEELCNEMLVSLNSIKRAHVQ